MGGRPTNPILSHRSTGSPDSEHRPRRRRRGDRRNLVDGAARGAPEGDLAAVPRLGRETFLTPVEWVETDLFKARLDQMVDMGHPLAKLAATIDWRFLEERFGAVYSDKPGQPPLPTRLMAGLSILKHTHNLSDEELCARWIENPYYQLFCGEEFFTIS